MNPKLLGVALVAIVVIAIGGYAFPNGTSTVVERTIEQLAAVAGPDSVYDYECVNGVCSNYFSSGLNQASTTLCSFKNTTSATTTLVFGSVKIMTASSSALALEIGKSSLPDATTTRISYDSSVPGQETLLAAFASTTAVYGALGQQHTADENDLVLAPNDSFVVKYGGSVCGNTNSAACNSLVGSCKAVLRVN